MAIFNINQIYTNIFGTIGEALPTGGMPRPGAIIRCPLTLAVNDVVVKLKFEPLITVNGNNVLIRKHVLKGKGKGTVKEYWTNDDYTIELKGLIQGDDDDRLPTTEIDQLRQICEARKVIEVSSPYLTMFSIKYMAIENFEFQHTPGYNNQSFIIKGYSDEPFELF